MMLYNNTSKLVLHYSLYGDGDIEGITLPRSDKVLLEADIDARIAKAKVEIDHLTNRLAHRVKHGGKRFRARQISIKDQRELCTARLKELESAKAIFVSHRIRYGANQEKIRRSVDTTTSIALIVPKSFLDHDSLIKNLGKKFGSAGSHLDEDLCSEKEVELEMEIDQQYEIDQKDFENDLYVSAVSKDD